MRQKYIARCIIVCTINLLLYYLALPRQCLGQWQPQSQSSSMQGSKEMQDFKARQQEKAKQYMSTLEKENQEFVNSLQGLGKEETISEYKDFISKQYDKNCAFRKQMNAEYRAFFEKQLNKNPNMQQSTKDRILSRIDQDYEEAKAFYAKKQEEDMEFLDGLLKDKSIDRQELNTKLQEFFKSQEAAGRDFAEKQKQKYRSQQYPTMR